MTSQQKQQNEEILYISFNQDSSYISVGTENGYKIFSSYPIYNFFNRNLKGGIGIIEMLYKSNILALVGGGKNPKFPENKLIIYDDKKQKKISEIIFKSNIINIKLKKDKIFSVTITKIFIFNFKTYQNIDIIETIENPKGLFSISNNPKVNIISFPIINNTNYQKGKIKIKNYDKGKEIFITLDENIISYMTMNNEGSIIVIACEKGTIIKTYRTIDGLFLQEFKRGSEKTEINFMTFDYYDFFLAICSQRGTIHIWSMKSSIKKLKEIELGNVNYINEENEIEYDVFKNNLDKNTNLYYKLPENKSSFFNFFGVKSERSFAQFRLENDKYLYKCAFCNNGNIIIAINSMGKFVVGSLDLKKGEECIIEDFGYLNEIKIENK